MKKFVSLVFLLFCSCNEEQQEMDCSGVAGGDAICGCTDSTAVNFSHTATYDDGTCEDCFGIAGGYAEYDSCGVCEGSNSCYGCTDNTASNYDSLATNDDGSCVFEIVKLTFESTGSINAHFDITKELPKFRCTVFSYADETVNIDSVWSHIVEGDFGNQDEDEFYLLNDIFNNVINISDLVDSLSNNTEIRITVLLNNNGQQLYEYFHPSEELLAILYFIEEHISEWCSINYTPIDNSCYNENDFTFLQELLGNIALSEMIGTEWNDDGRLEIFISEPAHNFVGIIPENFVDLDKLSVFIISNNQLSGGIPENLGNLANLNYLDLSGNQLSGEIPESIGNLTNLSYLDLSGNQLSGTLPETICNLDIQNIYINLNQNQFCPPYPECILDYIGEQACDE